MCKWLSVHVYVKVVLTCDRAFASKHVRRGSKVSSSMRLSATELFESCH